jgi:hypothetical protein
MAIEPPHGHRTTPIDVGKSAYPTLQSRSPASITRSEKGLDRLHQRYVGIFSAVFLDFVCVIAKFLSVDNQVPALPVKVAIQPNSNFIWMRDFVGRELVASYLCHVYYDLRE